jgi:hypothetical protein
MDPRAGTCENAAEKINTEVAWENKYFIGECVFRAKKLRQCDITLSAQRLGICEKLFLSCSPIASVPSCDTHSQFLHANDVELSAKLQAHTQTQIPMMNVCIKPNKKRA